MSFIFINITYIAEKEYGPYFENYTARNFLEIIKSVS
jgi:hypothetical protein